MKKNLLIPLFTFTFILHLAANAAVPLRWTVETSRAVPAQFEAYQGETLELEAAMQSYGKPLAMDGIAALYWQTNGMGNAYWQATAAVNSNRLSAVWTPEMDVGAKVYNCYIGSPSNIYHAAFQLRLRPSPGALPNELPLPVPVIDFARVRVLNPPWPGGGGGGTDTNAVRALVDASFVGGTNAVNAIPPRVTALEDEVAGIPRIAESASNPGYAANAVNAQISDYAYDAGKLMGGYYKSYAPSDIGRIEYTATTAAELAETNAVAIESHVANTNNPHHVTAEQVGALPARRDGEGFGAWVKDGVAYGSDEMHLKLQYDSLLRKYGNSVYSYLLPDKYGTFAMTSDIAAEASSWDAKLASETSARESADSALQAQIDLFKSFTAIVTNTLPAAGEDGCIYLVPIDGTENKAEWLWVHEPSNHWEQIGTTAIDMSDYAKSAELAAEAGTRSAADSAHDAAIANLVAAKMDKVSMGSLGKLVVEDASDSGFGEAVAIQASGGGEYAVFPIKSDVVAYQGDVQAEIDRAVSAEDSLWTMLGEVDEALRDEITARADGDELNANAIDSETARAVAAEAGVALAATSYTDAATNSLWTFKRDRTDLVVYEPVNERWTWTSSDSNVPLGWLDTANAFAAPKPVHDGTGWTVAQIGNSPMYAAPTDPATGTSLEFVFKVTRLGTKTFVATAARASATDTTPVPAVGQALARTYDLASMTNQPGVAVGLGSACSGTGSAIGQNAHALNNGAVAVGAGAQTSAQNGVAVGGSSQAGVMYSTAVGPGAKTGSSATYSVQLGPGTCNAANTLQFCSVPIGKTDAWMSEFTLDAAVVVPQATQALNDAKTYTDAKIGDISAVLDAILGGH